MRMTLLAAPLPQDCQQSSLRTLDVRCRHARAVSGLELAITREGGPNNLPEPQLQPPT